MVGNPQTTERRRRMSWVKTDDGMSRNRKILPLSDAAFRLDREAIEWCSANTTDGRIAADEFADISRRAIPKNVDELVRRGRWHKAQDGPCGHESCPTPGPDGWVIHDYLDYNPSKVEVEAEKKRKAERQRRWLEKKRGGASDDAAGDASRGRSANASRDTNGDASRVAAPSRPVPSRPDGGGTGTVPGGQPPAATRQDAAGGGPKDQNPPTAPPVPSNGRPDLAAAREAVRAAQAAARRPGANAGGLDRLRDATPDVPADTLVAEPERGAA